MLVITNKGDSFAYPMPDGSLCDRIVTWQNCQVVSVPITETSLFCRAVAKGTLVRMAHSLDIYLGDRLRVAIARCTP